MSEPTDAVAPCGRTARLAGIGETVCGAPIPRDVCPFDTPGCPFRRFTPPADNPVQRILDQVCAVRDLHQAVNVAADPPTGGYAGFVQLTVCRECRQVWPCRTQQAFGVRL